MKLKLSFEITGNRMDAKDRIVSSHSLTVAEHTPVEIETAKCSSQAVGSSFVSGNGKVYLVVDNDTIKTNVNLGKNVCTSHVTNMEKLFQNNTNIKVQISAWNTSKVTHMEGMFRVAESFNNKG